LPALGQLFPVATLRVVACRISRRTGMSSCCRASGKASVRPVPISSPPSRAASDYFWSAPNSGKSLCLSAVSTIFAGSISSQLIFAASTFGNFTMTSRKEKPPDPQEPESSTFTCLRCGHLETREQKQEVSLMPDRQRRDAETKTAKRRSLYSHWRSHQALTPELRAAWYP
jgi:hypothetical protein